MRVPARGKAPDATEAVNMGQPIITDYDGIYGIKFSRGPGFLVIADHDQAYWMGMRQNPDMYLRLSNGMYLLGGNWKMGDVYRAMGRDPREAGGWETSGIFGEAPWKDPVMAAFDAQIASLLAKGHADRRTVPACRCPASTHRSPRKR